MTDHGPIHYILDIHVEHNRFQRTIKIHQTKYIINILKRFNMLECHPIATPLEVNIKLSKDQCPQIPQAIEDMKNIPYASRVGALGYASITTRPALTYAVGEISQHSVNLGQPH